MNDYQNTSTAPVAEADVAEAPVLFFNEATGQFEDADGNPVPTEITEEGYLQSEGEVATPGDVTLH